MTLAKAWRLDDCARYKKACTVDSHLQLISSRQPRCYSSGESAAGTVYVSGLYPWPAPDTFSNRRGQNIHRVTL
ncbi:uncharacterized protein METZ01_LOCUS180432 [marine metagenome]|uniref:Uncharacterized protein n=1 Tax=marine metagenome TaxID=408172 RepID=A0A382CMY5_9ZZZZ